MTDALPADVSDTLQHTFTNTHMFKINPTRTPWRLLCALTAGTLTLPPTLSLQASPAMEQLFGILKAKGSLTQEEHDLLVSAMRADEAKSAAPAAAAPASASVLEKRVASQETKIKELESALSGTKGKVEELSASASPESISKKIVDQASKVEHLEDVIAGTKGQLEELSKVTDNTSPTTMSKTDLDLLLADKWYERIKLRGYGQFRYESVLNQDGTLNVPNDSFASDAQTLGLRRGRMVLSGDVSQHLYMYLQADFFGNLSGTNAMQARDYYADISLDPAREFRVRLGQSKVPFGWSNLQSSQNRLALERPDALNSAVEGERDFGAYLMWAPYEIRNRFKDLVKMGLRGSGDYGVVAIGAFSGQGLNRADVNGQTHYAARVAYPFEFPNGQFFEVGIQGYTGKFVPTAARVGPVGGPTPTFNARGVDDQRVGVTAILFPQPFGLEAEWNWGQGPVLSQDMKTITSGDISGGYVQASYRHIFANQQELIPFARWQHSDGGRKFATNAPNNQVDEIGVGLRYMPYPEMELTLMYTHGSRTNTTTSTTAPAASQYKDVTADYIGLQAQLNF